MQRPIVLVDAPSNLGLRQLRPGHVPGTWHAPEALERAGLDEALAPSRKVKLPRPAYETEAQPGSRLRNGQSIRAFNILLADAVSAAVAASEFPVVIGGDCSILLGALVGCRRHGPLSLVHVDGHSDFRHPGNYDSTAMLGAVAGMDLALATGRGEALLTHWPGVPAPLVPDEQVVQIGEREGRDADFAWPDVNQTAITRIDVFTAREIGVASVIERTHVADLLARRYRLLGVTGTVRMALSMLDIALWDAQAIARHVPLWDLLGAKRCAIAAYDSRGLGLMAPGPLADEALRLIEDRKLPAVKLRLGHPTLADDIAAVEGVLRVLPKGIGLMVDYNQALSPDEALRRADALDGYGLLWIEEPMRHDDYPAQARLAAEILTPLQIGENFNGPASMETALAVSACDYAMPDVARIGGVTGWLQSAALAAARGVPISSHLYPEISLFLLAASPTAHWLEYVDWAEAFLADPVQILDGKAMPSSKPGTGLDWDEDQIARL